MNKTIDLTYSDLCDENNKLFGKSRKTVFQAIDRLEQQYFKDKKILRNKGEGSDILFRWEIKNLLLILLQLEIENVFNDNKTQHTKGVSNLSMEKILNSYISINDTNAMRDYERMVLLSTSNSHGTIEFLNSLNTFKNVIKNLMTIYARYYHLFNSDYFYKIINAINTMSRDIIYSVYDIEENLKDCANSPYRAYPEFGKGLSIDLKKQLVKAINAISDEIYDFDSEGFCTRRINISYDKDFNEKYENFCSKHINMDTKPFIELSYDDSEYINKENDRKELDELMNEFWSNNRGKTEYRKNDYKHKSLEKMDEITTSIKSVILGYINAHCFVKGYIWGFLKKEDIKKIKKCTIEELFEAYEQRRQEISELKLSDKSFYDNIKNIEDDAWSLLIKKKTITKDECIEIIDKYVDEFRQKTDAGRIRSQEEFKMIESEQFEGTDLEGVSNNIHNIEKSCEDIMKNLLSMILKIESNESK
ncbi:MAG: hypothetical protein NC320_12415 [Clostridium sp.]|nr:hypothetical protein [Clostridium sp.]